MQYIFAFFISQSGMMFSTWITVLLLGNTLHTAAWFVLDILRIILKTEDVRSSKQEMQLMEGHSLVRLCKFCVQYNIGFNDFLKDAAFVNDFYNKTRYPADEPLIVTKEDTQECLDIAQKIIEFIDSLT